MNISSSVQAAPGQLGTIGFRVIDLHTRTVIQARTTAGITVASDQTDLYLWTGTVPDTDAWVEIWDTGGGSPIFSSFSYGKIPVVKATSGRTGILSIEVIDPLTNTVLVPVTTVPIVELVSGSGIYAYTGAAITTPVAIVTWRDGIQEATEELGSVPPTPVVKPPVVAPLLSYRNVGGRRTPQEIKRLRRENMDFCRRMGEAVILKHQYNNDDYNAGTKFLDDGGTVDANTDPLLAKHCPACWDGVYNNTRSDCPVCFGVGFVSLVNDNITNKWVENGGLSDTNLGSNTPAPKYGGYGPGYITWMVEPDVAVDVFRINEQGVMVQTENAQGVAPWFPDLGDNDLCINVELSRNQQTILKAEDRFQLKLTNPNTIRGFGRRGVFQNYKVSQQFAMARIPENTIWYSVPTDR